MKGKRAYVLVEVRFDGGKQMQNGRNGAWMNNERLVDGVVQRCTCRCVHTTARYQTVRLLKRLVDYWQRTAGAGAGVDR